MLLMRDEGVGPGKVAAADHARKGGTDGRVKDRLRCAKEEDQGVDGRKVADKDQAEDEDRPDEISRDEHGPTVEAVGEDADERASQRRQQTRDQDAAHGGGAAREVHDQKHQRHRGDGVADEREPSPEPEPHEAGVFQEELAGAVHHPSSETNLLQAIIHPHRVPSPSRERTYSRATLLDGGWRGMRKEVPGFRRPATCGRFPWESRFPGHDM